jgi:hypothetical protein
MNIDLIEQTTDIQSSFGMSGHFLSLAACAKAAHFAVPAADLTQGEVALKPATFTRHGWVRGTSAWRPPSV